MDVICPGSCNSAYRRAADAYTERLAAYVTAVNNRTEGQPEPQRPEPPVLRPWEGSPVWCSRCISQLRTQLAELDDLAAILAAIPDLRSSSDNSGVRVSGSRGHASPSPFLDDVDELEGWLRQWESAFRGQDPLARRGYLATAITTITRQLVLHFDNEIVHPDMAEDFGKEIRQWHRSLSGKAKAGTGLKHQKKPCPRCKEFTLWRSDGEAYVKCVNVDCQRLMSLNEFDALDSEAAA